VAAGLGRVPDGALVAMAPTDAIPAPLASKIASLVGGRLGPATEVLASMALDEMRTRAETAPGFVVLSASIGGGRVHLSADSYPTPRTVWSRARSTQPGPVAHAAVHAPIDAEVRRYLTPLVFDKKPSVSKYEGADPDMQAMACGDLDGDGVNDVVTMSRSRVLRVSLKDGKVERTKDVLWADLAPVAPVPLRQPIAFATIVEGRSGYIDVSTTDRAKSVRLDAQLSVVKKMKGMAVPYGRATACTWVTDMKLGNKLVKCDEAAPSPDIAEVAHQSDAFASAFIIGTDGKGKTVAALRRDKGVLVVRDVSGERIVARVGAQVAVGDIDQDGVPEVVTTMDVLSRKFDAIDVRSLLEDKIEKRFRVRVPTGVEALALCPPDGPGRAPIVLASKGQIWVVR
jgi:hypothetical protein